MGTHTGNVLTLANSIIGVSVLAMPFCFKQCGIVLSILMLLFSNFISRLACHYLMKSAILEKRKNFEMLAFRAFGPTGKLTVELCIIGFMLGTCVAYFVIMGDLGPGIIGPTLGFQHPAALRPSVLIAIAIFVVLPLGLLKNVDSLSGVCAATVAFYACLVLKVLGEAIQHLMTADWMDKVYYWRPGGMLQCIPIFSMALSCQTQLFEIFDSLPSTPLDRMNSVVRSATNMVTLFYISVGLFGYIAYCDQTFTGNLMMSFSKTMTSEVIKIGFLMSVAVSFPLVIFPCRASIHSLLFSKGYEHAQTGSAHIPESRFQCITLVIVTLSLVTGLLIPNIELVLGLVGSTIGVIICVIVPALIFVSLSSRNNNERLLAKSLMFIGLVILVLGTYANLYATEEAISKPDNKPHIRQEPPQIQKDILEKVKDETLKNLKSVDDLAAAIPKLKPGTKIKQEMPKVDVKKDDIIVNVEKVKDTKREPPIPEEPVKDIKIEPPIPEEPVKEIKIEPPVPEEPVIQIEPKDPKLNIPPKDILSIINLPLENDLRKVENLPKADGSPALDSPTKEEVKNKLASAEESIKLKDEVKVDGANNEKVKKNDNEKIENIETEFKKEILIEKIKEHQAAQEKLIAEGEELMNELKLVVKDEGEANVSKHSDVYSKSNINLVPQDAVKVVEKKEEKKVEPEKVKDIVREDPLVVSMAKGVPLPLAVKSKLDLAVKQKENRKLENEVVEKIGRDILGGDTKELREKRDLEEVLTESSRSVAGEKTVELTTPGPEKADKVDAKAPILNVEDKPLNVAKVEEGTCSKNSTSPNLDKKEDIQKLLVPDTVSNRTDKEQFEKKPDDELIKFSSHLSDPKPILDVSPQLLNDKADSVIVEMPKKRDLKSIEMDEPESDQRVV